MRHILINKNRMPYNLNYLKEISEGDKEFMKQLIDIFLEQVPEFITNMKKFYAENELDALAKEAHTAKSSVLIFGMENSGILLKKIQLLAEKNEVDTIPGLMEIVENELENVVKELEEIEI